METKIYTGWHFVGKTLRDGSPIPKIGKWLKYPGQLMLCKSGLHWSVEPFDALQYAPGSVLCKIEARGETLFQSDKAVSTERRIAARADVSEMLNYFARMQTLSVIHLYPNGTDDAVFDYLMTGEDRAAAESAAESAARSVAWSAAESAARSVARSAAESAARSVAWSAAESAAWSAAWSAARSAAWLTQREYFNHLVNEQFS